MSTRLVAGDCIDVFGAEPDASLDAFVSDWPAGVAFIYSLHDPDTMERRYIGKAKDVGARYRQHLKPYYLRPDTYKNRWLRGLLARGLRPAVVVLCEAGPHEDINRISVSKMAAVGNGVYARKRHKGWRCEKVRT